jgi:hypothetical protein
VPARTTIRIAGARLCRRLLRLVPVCVLAGASLIACSSGQHKGSLLTGSGSAAAASPASESATATSVPSGSATATSVPSASATSECPVTAAPVAGLRRAPEGLIAFSIYQSGRVPFPSEVFTDPSVSGVGLFVQWSNLEPEPNTFNWSILDCVFQQADEHNKFVSLAISPGFTTPSWVLQLPGVETQSFMFSYSDNAPARPLPLPWNQPYLDSWFACLKEVAARYGTNPEFRLIQVGGPTSVSTEMSLPDRTSGDTALPASTHGSDIAEWMHLGYTPTRYVDAWKQAFAQYHQLFPNQYLGLALYPGLPIGDKGQSEPSQSNATRLEVIAVGLQYKQVFVLEEEGMKGVPAPPSDPAYNAVMANCGNIVTGIGNAKSATVSPGDQGPPDLALRHVVAAGVRFWEVYTQDVLNPSMQSTMATASAELPADKGCKPLVINVESRTSTSVTITAVTDLRLDPVESLNIFKGTTLLRTCSTSTCSVQTSPGSASTAYTADVGAPGTPPYSNQAVVSARINVSSP